VAPVLHIEAWKLNLVTIFYQDINEISIFMAYVTDLSKRLISDETCGFLQITCLYSFISVSMIKKCDP
jgi:hypothetical protein